MKIRVTETDIGNGISKDDQRCPIALALSRRFPDLYVSVSYLRLQIGDQYFLTNEQMRDFVANFDSGLPVAPIEIDLDELKLAE